MSSPADTGRAAGEAYTKGCRRLKLKFAGDGDDERLIAVRAAAPDASLIIDANEAWDESMLAKYLPLLENQGVELLEQPLPVGVDEVLRDIETSLAIAPAFKLAARANFVDLDAPLPLCVDRVDGFGVNDSFIYENIQSKIWGWW